MLKTLVCKKTAIPHMTRTCYDPSCLRFCSELCGIRCKNLCNKDHTGGCDRGNLPMDFLFCPTADSQETPDSIGFVTYETRDVDTFGKGVPYKRVEKIVTDHSYEEFKSLVKQEFHRYSEHTLSYWFLRATKLEAFSPSLARSTTATITSDFGEAIQIIAKQEVSDQFFHRPEVFLFLHFYHGKSIFLQQVCLFGSVAEITIPSEDGSYKNYSVSHIITSDYK